MKKELEERLLNSLDKVADFVEQSSEFASKEAPLVAQEIVNLKMIEAVTLFLHFGAMLIAVLVLFKISSFFKKRKEMLHQEVRKYGKDSVNEDPDVLNIFYYVAAGIGLIVLFNGFGALFKATESLLEAYFTPRLLIIEEIKVLLRRF